MPAGHRAPISGRSLERRMRSPSATDHGVHCLVRRLPLVYPRASTPDVAWGDLARVDWASARSRREDKK